jgi:hypothetical protein
VVWVSWPEPEVAEERDRDADAVWWQYQHAHAEVTRAVEAELLAFHQLSLASFEVLTSGTLSTPRRRCPDPVTGLVCRRAPVRNVAASLGHGNGLPTSTTTWASWSTWVG